MTIGAEATGLLKLCVVKPCLSIWISLAGLITSELPKKDASVQPLNSSVSEQKLLSGELLSESFVSF